MSDSNGQPLSPAAGAIAACVEPFYAGVMRIRNALYDRGLFAIHSLRRPAISVGNITTGGTGKTPVSIWLADRLARANHQPAILLRGYKPTAEGISDEAEVLRAALAGRVPVIVDPDRIRGAAKAIQEYPQITVFVLDDAMQHRRAARNFDLVLVNATNPFGFDHILPRGLLREPMDGLKRAGAFLITHASEASAPELERIESTLREHNSSAGIFRADHQITGFLDAEGRPVDPTGKKFFAFCGLGSPGSFFAGLVERLGEPVGRQAFPDHHSFTSADLNDLQSAAGKSGAEFLITTQKDWAKISHHRGSVPILRAELAVRFRPNDEDLLFNSILKSLTTAP
jgi:tetraacyldisaccharide 4'-kinase